MASKDLISKSDAAREKGTSPQNVDAAIVAFKLTTKKVAGRVVIVRDAKYAAWTPKRRTK